MPRSGEADENEEEGDEQKPKHEWLIGFINFIINAKLFFKEVKKIIKKAFKVFWF